MDGNRAAEVDNPDHRAEPSPLALVSAAGNKAFAVVVVGSKVAAVAVM